MFRITENIQRIIELCRKYNVKALYVFGSILTNKFNDKSDVDLLVNFNETIDHNNYANNYFDFIEELENLFKRKVDLVDADSLRNIYFINEVEKTKQKIYG